MPFLKKIPTRKTHKKKKTIVKISITKRSVIVKKRKKTFYSSLFISIVFHLGIGLLFFKLLANTLFNLNIDTQHQVIQTASSEPIKLVYYEQHKTKVVVAKKGEKNESKKVDQKLDLPLSPDLKILSEETTSIIASTSSSDITFNEHTKDSNIVDLIQPSKPMRVSHTIKSKTPNKNIKKHDLSKQTLKIDLVPPSPKQNLVTQNSQTTLSKRTPLRINNKRPIYPKLAKRLGHSGKVEFKVWIRANGKISKTELVSSSGSKILDSAAKKAIVKYEFEINPNGMSVAIIPIIYKLN